MVTFGPVEAAGLLALSVIAVFAVIAVRQALETRGLSKDAKKIHRKLDDFDEREEIGRLRHRDFDAFLARLNKRRAKLGQEALDREYLLPHQFNLMYSVDAGDVDEAGLAELRKRVGKAVKNGEEPPLKVDET